MALNLQGRSPGVYIDERPPAGVILAPESISNAAMIMGWMVSQDETRNENGISGEFTSYEDFLKAQGDGWIVMEVIRQLALDYKEDGTVKVSNDSLKKVIERLKEARTAVEAGALPMWLQMRATAQLASPGEAAARANENEAAARANENEAAARANENEAAARGNENEAGARGNEAGGRGNRGRGAGQ